MGVLGYLDVKSFGYIGDKAPSLAFIECVLGSV